MSKSDNFKRKLLEASISDNYEEALEEWRVVGNFEADGNCICSQVIFHNYLVKNNINSNMLIIGSDCIKKFLGKEVFENYTDLQFLRNIIDSNQPILSLNMPSALLKKTVKSLLTFNLITEWEGGFLESVCRKRNSRFYRRGLTSKQREVYNRIKSKIDLNLHTIPPLENLH